MKKLIKHSLEFDQTFLAMIRNPCDAFGAGMNMSIPYAYLGKRYDPDSGLFYFGRRYYDPTTHRWLTPDPLGEVDHSNLYQYVFNNPYYFQDPKGEFAIPLFSIALGGSAFCPLTWGIIAAAGIGYAACWGVQHMMDRGSFQSGSIPHTVVTGFAGMLTERLIQNDWNLSVRSLYEELGEFPYHIKKDNERRSSDEEGSPPYRGDKLGDDPTKLPDVGFEWRGKGEPGSGRGKWVRGSKDNQEGLYPDLQHLLGKKLNNFERNCKAN